jgi:hypothetical protein
VRSGGPFPLQRSNTGESATPINAPSSRSSSVSSPPLATATAAAGVGSSASHATVSTSTTSTSAAIAPTSPTITMSVNGVQFAVPSGASVDVRVPVHAVPLHAAQRTVQPTLMRTTPLPAEPSSSSGVHHHHHTHHQHSNSGEHARPQSPQSPPASATFSPTSSRRETVSNSAASNPAVQLSASLLRAVRAGSLGETRELLAQGASAALLHGAVSPFHVAALQSDPAVMELLLQAPGVNTELKNRNGETALHYASYHRNAPIQRTLLHAGANVHARTTGGDTALHLAASVGASGGVLEQLLSAMSVCPLQPRNVCCQRVALTIALHDLFGRSVLARAVVNGTLDTVQELLGSMPTSGACACACGLCASGECAVAARATWRQTLLATDAFARVCDANLLLSAARHGPAPDGVFAIVLKACWRSVCEVLSHDAARALLARYLTMLSREQSVCSLLQMDTDAIHEKFLVEPSTPLAPAAPATTTTTTTTTTTISN